MFYSVVAGCKVGIFLFYQECLDAVMYKEGAQYECFHTLLEAVQHQNKFGFKHNAIQIHKEDVSFPLFVYCATYGEPEIPPAYSELNLCFPFGHNLCANLQFYAKKKVLVKLQQGDNTITLSGGQWFLFKTLTEEFEEALKKIKDGEHIEYFQYMAEHILVELRSPLAVFNMKYCYPYEKFQKRNKTINITFRESEWRHLLNLSYQIDNVIQEEGNAIKESLV